MSGRRESVLSAEGRRLALAAAALIVALAGPVARLERDVYEYVLVLDITQSMNTRDYVIDGRPASRLAYAKAALARAIAALPCGSRVGLGVFTEHRSMLLLAPVDVCEVSNELKATLARLDGRMAWAGASEVAKGLYSALHLAKGLDPPPGLVFVSDGHEAPPLHPRLRPAFRGQAGEVRGIVVGTGGFVPMPIPKYDMAGNPLGYWSAEDVVQTDVVSRGRAASVAGETMVDADGRPVASVQRSAEHLSLLKEEHLRELARETGLGYRRLTNAADLTHALARPELARRAEAPTDLRPAAGLVALWFLFLAAGGAGALPWLRRRLRAGAFAPTRRARAAARDPANSDTAVSRRRHLL